MQKELVRSVMILNEIHVEIARNVARVETYNDLSERLNEVKDVLLDLAYGQDDKSTQYVPENMSHTGVIPEIDWSDMKKYSDGC
jgi:hypothetical protein